MYEELKLQWNRDRIAEIRGEFHWLDFWFGVSIGMAVCAILFIR